MDLSNLKPAEGATKNNKRLGRGVGSGTGGHSSTRGDKGQTSRSGNRKMPFWFEGGQMPLQRRLPKWGFNNKKFRTEYRPVNVSRLAYLVEEGRLESGQQVTPETFVELGLASKQELVKVLGSGEIDVALDVSAHAFSSSAEEKISAAGGSTTVVDK